MNRRAFVGLLGTAFVPAAWAKVLSHRRFKVGDQVMVFFPSPDIQKDAFILGIVKGYLPDGRVRLQVTDYVEGHDYGLSCEPLPPEDVSSEYGPGWQKWEDPGKLRQDIEYAVPADKLMPAGDGRMYAVSRNNIWTKFARWLSDAPVLYVDELAQVKEEAKQLGLAELEVPFELAIAHRQAFYAPVGHPYWPYEVVPRLVPLLNKVQALLNNDPQLKHYFFAKKRDWKKINQSTYLLFTIRALDKIVHDAHNVLYEEGMDKVDPKVLRQVKQQLKALGVKLYQ